VKPTRPIIYGGVLLLSLLLAFLVRDLARDLLITPLAYLAWQIGLLYWAVPQLVKWAAAVLLLCIVVFWQLIPDFRSSNDRTARHRASRGQVEALAVWIHRARSSTYFKWQLANRLGHIADKLQDSLGRRGRARAPVASVEEYLAAGLQHSFVDFPMPRHPFQRRAPTPLDLPPEEAVAYIESQMETVIGSRPQSR
jgi:hypothetical protein